MPAEIRTPTQPRDIGDVLATGFGMTVAMWAVGYFSRLFGDAVPGSLLFVLFMVILVVGGFIVGRGSARGRRAGMLAGLTAGLLNLLIVGSLVGGDRPNSIGSTAPVWIFGTLVVSIGFAYGGAALGRLLKRDAGDEPDWAGGLAIVAVVATFLLLAAGGLVTGTDEGLAVVDWPNTEGYNMFLYPLARMTGGIYLEHSHRLLGTLVGLTTITLALHTQLTDRRRWIKVVTWSTLGIVVIQGILGGLRVTGRFTLSTDPAHTQPSVVLAIIHGVFGQVVFAALVAVAVFRCRAWRESGEPTEARGVGTDRAFAGVLIVVLLVQLVLGALVRHFTWALQILPYGLDAPPKELIETGRWALHLHITVAVIVAMGAVAVGVRAWGLYQHIGVLSRLGVGLLLLTAVQLALGIAALVVTGNDAPQRRPTAVDVAVTTAHQVVGAALLALAVMTLFWSIRRLTGRVSLLAMQGEEAEGMSEGV